MNDEERLPCGHTEKEHADKAKLVGAAVATGNLTPLVPYLDNDALAAAMQATIMETFIRSQDDEVAQENWERIKTMVDTTFFPEDGVSAFPEVRDGVIQERESFAKQVEAVQFQDEAQDEMRTLFEKHGVEEHDDDWPGQYL